MKKFKVKKPKKITMKKISSMVAVKKALSLQGAYKQKKTKFKLFNVKKYKF